MIWVSGNKACQVYTLVLVLLLYDNKYNLRLIQVEQYKKRIPEALTGYGELCAIKAQNK